MVQDYNSQHLSAVSLYSSLPKHPVLLTWNSKIHKAMLYFGVHEVECGSRALMFGLIALKNNVTPAEGKEQKAGEWSNEDFFPSSQPCLGTISFLWWFGITIPSLGKLLGTS